MARNAATPRPDLSTRGAARQRDALMGSTKMMGGAVSGAEHDLQIRGSGEASGGKGDNRPRIGGETSPGEGTTRGPMGPAVTQGRPSPGDGSNRPRLKIPGSAA
jgi:hypothetical protein